jgi:predicted N-acetyltransferase YhbS
VSPLRAAVEADLPALRAIFAATLELEPVERAALVDLLFHRPGPPAVSTLVAVDNRAVVGGIFFSQADDRGYVDGFAVHPQYQRRGIGGALVRAAQMQLRGAGARVISVGDNTETAYAWPGIDLRYAAATAMVERAGFRRSGTAQNMTVDLAPWTPRETALGPGGPVIRRAERRDAAALDTFIAGARFSPVWAREARRALHRTPPTVFLAVTGGVISGFACYAVYRVDWFGPIGVDPLRRNASTGRALLIACLNELAAAGIAQAQICWIGPAGFYRRTVGARCERTFGIYVRESPR